MDLNHRPSDYQSDVLPLNYISNSQELIGIEPIPLPSKETLHFVHVLSSFLSFPFEKYAPFSSEKEIKADNVLPIYESPIFIWSGW